MISKHAVVETDAIGTGVKIHEFSVIRAHVTLGDGVIVHPGVVIEEGVTIGNRTELFPGAYVGKEPKGAGVTARPLSFKAELVIGDDCVVGPNSVIYYDVVLGNNTLVGDGASIREGCRIGYRCVIGRYVTLNYAIDIGDEVKIMDHCWLAGNMRIGSHVFISGGVLTTNDNMIGMQGYDEKRVIGPEIRDWVRVGAGAILLPQIVVGEHAVIGAGAVVTKDVAPFDVVMGTPARFVRNIRDALSKQVS